MAMVAADALAADAAALSLDARLVRGARDTAVATAEAAVLELRRAKANPKLLEAAEQVGVGGSRCRRCRLNLAAVV